MCWFGWHCWDYEVHDFGIIEVCRDCDFSR